MVKQEHFAIEIESNDSVKIDIDKLIDGRAFIDGDSGSGKSHLVCSIIEANYNKVQQIIIDPEGEYFPLKNNYDFLLIGKSFGDVKMDIELNLNDIYVEKLAEKLLDSGANAIIDLSEFPNDMIHFVAVFAKSLLNARKKFNHSVIVYIEEAHIFTPEKSFGNEESLKSLADMARRGRKRGIGTVFITQAVADFSKTVLRQLKTRFIGNCTHDSDVKRAGEYLGFDKSRHHELRELSDNHEFFAVGQAITVDGKRPKTVIKIKAMETFTKLANFRTISDFTVHDNKKIAQLKTMFSDIPQELDKELSEKELLQKESIDLKNQLIEIKKQLQSQPKILSDSDKQKEFQKGFKEGQQKTSAEYMEIINSIKNRYAKLHSVFELMGRSFNQLEEAVQNINSQEVTISNIINGLREELPEFDKIDLDIRKQLTRQETLVEQPIIQQAQKQMPDGIKLKAGAVKMLSYCASYGTITRTRLKTFAGLSANTFNSYLSILQSGQLIIVSGNEITITENGLGIVDAKPLPLTNQDVLSLWQHQFKKGIGEILAYICKNRSGVTIDNIRENMNLSENTLNSYLSILRSNDLIIELNGKFKPSDDMFPEG